MKGKHFPPNAICYLYFVLKPIQIFFDTLHVVYTILCPTIQFVSYMKFLVDVFNLRQISTRNKHKFDKFVETQLSNYTIDVYVL